MTPFYTSFSLHKFTPVELLRQRFLPRGTDLFLHLIFLIQGAVLDFLRQNGVNAPETSDSFSSLKTQAAESLIKRARCTQEH